MSYTSAGTMPPRTMPPLPAHVMMCDNEKLVTPEMKAKVEAAKADIVSGKIVVHDYKSNNSCKP